MNALQLTALAATLLVLTGVRPPEAASAAELQGGPYAILGTPVANAGAAAGGQFSVRGLSGLPTHGTIAAGPFALGPIILDVPAPPENIRVSIEWIQEDEVRMAWTPGAATYRLEMTEDPTNASSWLPVTPAPEGSGYTTRVDVPARFYRLRRP